MRRKSVVLRWVLSVLVLLAAVPSPGFGQPSSPAPRRAVPRTGSPGLAGSLPDRVLVRFRDTSAARLDRTLGTHGLKRADVQLKGHGLGGVKVPRGRSRDALIAELRADPNVVYAEPVLYRQLSAYEAPDDPTYNDPTTWSWDSSSSSYGKSWWLRPTGINAASAWTHGFSDPSARDFPTRASASSFKVGVIDTGFYMSHPDRGANIVAGHDFFDHYTGGVFYEDDDVNPPPDTALWYDGYSWAPDVYSNSHGTDTAGQIAAATHNATGVASSGYDDRAIIYKVAGYFTEADQGIPANGVVITSEAMTAAMYRAADDGVKVISISLGGDIPSTAEQDAVDYAWSRGVAVLAATGNEGSGSGASYPARYDHVTGVGSYGVNGTTRSRSSFTNYGTGLDILAPGDLVYGLMKPTYDDGYGEVGYTFWRGTSMATPAAAGALAHMWRYVPTFTNDQIVALLEQTAVPGPGAQPSNGYGWGYLDLSGTMSSIMGTYAYLAAPSLHVPAAPVAPGPTTISWDAVTGHAVVYEVDLDGSFVASTTATTATVTLVEGSHTVRVQATSVLDYYDDSSAATAAVTAAIGTGSWGGFAPEGWVTTLTPSVVVGARDVTSGLEPGTAEVRSSSDGGASWTSWTPAAMTGLPGSIATETISATATFAADSDTLDRVEFRVTNGVGVVETSPAFSVKVDSTPPTGTLTLAGGAAEVTTTSVAVTSAVTDAHALEMRLSGDAGATWTSWSSYATSTTVRIPDSEGPHEVRAEYRDAAGNVLALSGTVTLQYAPPGTPTDSWAGFQPSSWVSTLTPLVSIRARDVTSGLAAGSAEVRWTSDAGITWSAWAPAQLTGLPGSIETETISAAVTFAADSEIADRVQFRVRNGASLVGTSPAFTVRVDTHPPVGTLSAPAEVVAPGLTVTSAVTDAHLDSMRLSTDGGTTWTTWLPYAAETSVTLPGGRGTKTIVAQYRDVAGNVLMRSRDVFLALPPLIARLEGPNRYDTAIRVSKEHFTHADTVVVATGAQFPDALSAAALAGSYDAPLLLTTPSSLYPPLAAEIARLGARHAIVIGSERAVSALAYTQLDTLPGVTVERVWGADRYGTSAAIASAVKQHEQSEGRTLPGGYFIARGDDFADALAASPVAYGRHMPIVLTRTTSVPAATWSAIRTVDPSAEGTAVIAGSTTAVGPAVTAALDGDGRRWQRVWGATRYDTAGKLADYATAHGWADWRFVGIATGANFPDALGGGAATGAMGGVMLLSPPASLAPQVSERLLAHDREVMTVDLFGGTPALSVDVMTEVAALF